MPDKKNSDLGQKQRNEFRAVVTLTDVRAFGSWRPHARSDSFAVWRKSRADEDDGYLRKKPWVSSLGGVLSVAFCRHGQKATKTKQPDKLQFFCFSSQYIFLHYTSVFGICQRGSTERIPEIYDTHMCSQISHTEFTKIM